MTTARSVPRWRSTSKVRDGLSQPRTAGTTTRCPLEEMGRNSVSPWSRPRKISWNMKSASVVTRPSGREGAERLAAAALPLGRDGGDEVEEEDPDPVQIRREELEHLGLGDRHPRLVFPHAGVVVGDEGDGGVAHAQLPGEVGLRVLRHVDDLPTLI